MGLPAAGESRAATDRLLTDVRAGGWTPRAWLHFFGAASARSIDQARRHRPALWEATALHGMLLLVFGHRGRRRLATSWLLTISHLGTLERNSHLGAANTMTLVRGSLPACVPRPRPWLAVAALATDLVDGRSARATGTTTPFGQYADAFADAAFWIWFVREDRPVVRSTATLTWSAPALAVTALSVGRGRMVDAPRPRVLRPAATLQVLLTLRALVRRSDSGWSAPRSRQPRRSA